LRGEVADLAQEASEMANPVPRKEIEQQCATWNARLERIGATCGEPSDLRHDREQLQKVETEIRAGRGLAKLASLLADLGAWSHHLSGSKDQVESLEEQRRRLIPVSEPAELQQLASKIGQLHESLANRSNEQRNRAQAELADRLAALSKVCGCQP